MLFKSLAVASLAAGAFAAPQPQFNFFSQFANFFPSSSATAKTVTATNYVTATVTGPAVTTFVTSTITPPSTVRTATTTTATQVVPTTFTLSTTSTSYTPIYTLTTASTTIYTIAYKTYEGVPRLVTVTECSNSKRSAIPRDVVDIPAPIITGR